MAESKSVIRKQIIKLTAPALLEEQTFEVPIDAEMVEIGWDSEQLDGIAFWYMVSDSEAPFGRGVQFWSFYVRSTGHSFPQKCTHLATVTRDGFEWHVLDADGGHIPWAEF